MRLPWTRHPPTADQAQTAEAARIKRLKEQTEAFTDRLALAMDALEHAMKQRNQTMRPGDQPWPRT